MKLEWTNVAEADREAVYRYVEESDPRAALALDKRFERIAGRLVRFPMMGRIGRVSGTRELVAHRSYVLVYEIDGGTVRILRLLHTSRLWPPEE